METTRREVANCSGLVSQRSYLDPLAFLIIIIKIMQRKLVRKNWWHHTLSLSLKLRSLPAVVTVLRNSNAVTVDYIDVIAIVVVTERGNSRSCSGFGHRDQAPVRIDAWASWISVCWIHIISIFSYHLCETDITITISSNYAPLPSTQFYFSKGKRKQSREKLNENGWV